MKRDDKIVRLARADGLADPDRSRLEAHWRDIGGSRDIPARTDLDPNAIAPCLDRMLVFERIAPQQARVRLAGQAVAALPGHDLRGMPLSSLVVPPSRDWLRDAVAALFDQPARIELGLAGPRSTFRVRARAALMLLPLRDVAGGITMGIGFMTFGTGTSTTPARFEICGETRRQLQCKHVQGESLAATANTPDFEGADRAREVLRRRRSFHVVS